MSGNAKLVAKVGAGTAALLIATVAAWEGKRNDPYLDLVGVATVCYGETQVPMRRYSDAECRDMLAGSLTRYVGAVKTRNPDLTGPQLAAATSLAYNIGPAAYTRSTVARRFEQGRVREACDAFRAWVYAGGRRVQGLVNRREDERRLCLMGVK